MDALAKKIERNRNLISTSSQTLAVMGLEKVGRTTAGKVLTPAVWVTNYTVNGELPDTTDVGLWGMGLSGGVAGPAAIFTGLVKSIVDDDMNNKLSEIKRGEASEYRKTIFPCYKFAMTPPAINALKIASLGGTAWQHPNGLWVYIMNLLKVSGRFELKHVPNFKPNRFRVMYQPVWPLQKSQSGGLRYTVKRSS